MRARHRGRSIRTSMGHEKSNSSCVPCWENKPRCLPWLIWDQGHWVAWLRRRDGWKFYATRDRRGSCLVGNSPAPTRGSSKKSGSCGRAVQCTSPQGTPKHGRKSLGCTRLHGPARDLPTTPPGSKNSCSVSRRHLGALPASPWDRTAPAWPLADLSCWNTARASTRLEVNSALPPPDVRVWPCSLPP